MNIQSIIGIVIVSYSSITMCQDQMPLDTMELVDCRSKFGRVRVNVDGSKRSHQGWDLKSKVGEPVFAVATGVITKGFHKDYGFWVQIKSNKSGYYYFYAHLLSMAQFEFINKGEVLGKVGRSGNVPAFSPSHLHFEMRTRPSPGLGLSGRLSPSVGIGWKHKCGKDFNNTALSLSSRR